MLHVLVETVYGLQYEGRMSSADACRLFKEKYKDYPHHLHFRAFHETAEYTWLETQGIATTVGTEGDYEVHEKPLRAFLNGAGEEWRVATLQNIVSKGRVIYQKIHSLQEG